MRTTYPGMSAREGVIRARPTPALGYCLGCLRLIEHTLSATDADQGFVIARAGGYPSASLRSVAAAVDAWEFGASVSVQSREIRMRADVVRNGQPLCCDHMDAV